MDWWINRDKWKWLMNSAEVLWEVIIVKWDFWQWVSKQLSRFRLHFTRGRLFLCFQRTFALCHGGSTYSGTPLSPRVSFSFSRAESRSSWQWVTHLLLEYVRFCLCAFVEMFFSDQQSIPDVPKHLKLSLCWTSSVKMNGAKERTSL